jgi:hypothetical protein
MVGPLRAGTINQCDLDRLHGSTSKCKG